MRTRHLRVLQVSTMERTGGAALSAWYLHQAYRQRGLKSWMAVGRKETDDPDVFEVPNDARRGAWARSWLRLGRALSPVERHLPRALHLSRPLAVLAEPSRHRDIGLGREDFCYPGSRDILALAPEKPDIVNCHNLHGGYFDLTCLPRLSAEAPVVLSLRDEWLLTGHCAMAVDCGRWETGCGSCPDLTLYPAIRRDATAFNWSRKQQLYAATRVWVITPSRWLMDRVGRSMLAAAVIDGRVIPNAVDTSVFRPGDAPAARRDLGLPPDGPIILFAAQAAVNNPFKDLATVERAVEQVAAAGHTPPPLLVCLGGAPASTQTGHGRIRFVPYVEERARVASYYQAADVYIHAARSEVWGKTVTEAMACGAPVVATAVGGIPEQVADGETGFLTPAGDAGAMAARVSQLLADPALRRTMGSRAAEVAHERFSLDRQVDEHLRFFSAVADRQPPAGRETS